MGARFTGLQALASVEDHIVVCEDAEATVLVVTAPLEEHGRQVLAEVGSLRHLMVIPAAGGLPEGESYAVRPLVPGPATETDLAWLQYTGGTTGRPKGVMQPHRSMVQMVCAHMADFEQPHLPRYLAPAPLTHAAGLGVLPTLLRGGTVVIEQGFDPGRFLDIIEAERINCVTGIPTMIYTLLDEERPETRDLSSLEVIWYATGPMSPVRLAEARERIGPVFSQIYGQTESTGIGTVLPKAAHETASLERLASCGRPVVGNRVRLIDEDGHDVPVGEVGEIAMRNRGVMLGYRNLPEETEAALKGGWLHTGDLARQDDEGLLYIIDRKKDMIISGGFNIYASEVEAALAGHPSVGSAAVIGVPDDRWGEIVTAFVVARPGQDVDVLALQSFVKQAKGSMYSPKKVVVVDSLPQTPVGKVDKKALRAPYWSDPRAQSPLTLPHLPPTSHERYTALTTPPPRLIDFHSHWGTERGWKGSPYETAEDREALRGYFKWGMNFVSDDEQAAQFRQANAKVMLDFAYTYKMDAGALRDQHDYAFDFAHTHPDVVLGNWIGIDPTQPDHVKELERCLSEGPGLIGLTVHSFTPAGTPDQPEWENCLNLCIEANRPVLVHVGMSATGAGTRGGMGITLEGCHPRYVDRIAATHPDLNVIAARVAWPWQSEMIAVALHKANVWMELHGWSPRYFPDELKREIGKRLRKRVFFGADYPMLSHERLVEEWREQGFSSDVLDDVFSGNAESFLTSIGVE